MSSTQRSGEKDEASTEAKEPVLRLPEGLEILVVEDSPTLRRLWSKLLLEQKCAVETATNGSDALDKCSVKRYDVVLMDITMPVMSGDEAVKKLRERGYPGVVIALTANAMETDKAQYLEAGMDTVITKPFKMAELQRAVTEQLSKRGGRSGKERVAGAQ